MNKYWPKNNEPIYPRIGKRDDYWYIEYPDYSIGRFYSEEEANKALIEEKQDIERIIQSLKTSKLES